MSEEQRLWASIVRRETAAFERLYGEHGSPVRRFLNLYLGDSAAADDLTQETFLQVWRRPSAFNPARSKIRSYLLGIARKRAADWWRHQKRAAQAPPTQQQDAETTTVVIMDALRQLPPDSRDVLWLREVEGYSYEELAEILAVPVGTVRSRLHTSREQLREIWSKGMEKI
jgi:RNA polymerase sigma-70 factor, ECF subfamily